MLQEINDQITGLKTKQRQKVNWELRVQALTKELKNRKRERDQWAAKLQQEQKDVERLTGISLGNLFYTLIGRKDEKLTQEEEEVLQAKLKYEEADDTVAEIESEIADLMRQLADMQYIDTAIATAIQRKKALIQEMRPDVAAELQSLTDQEEEAQMNQKELEEAVTAGKALVRSLRQAEERLDSAKNWGTYDMLGGGLLSTAVKHNRIDQARSAIHAAQKNLRRFQTELKDVERDAQIHIDIGGMLTFADYFFDGLITDWMVQGRIQQSLAQVKEKRAQINRIVSTLETECRRAEERVQELQRKRTALIESA